LSESESARATRRWLQFAREDLDAARLYLNDHGIAPRIICWHAQQSAEKAIKAILVFNNVEFPYRHDLNLLLTLVPDSWETKHTKLDVSELTYWATSARYPGDLADATVGDASEAVQTAAALLEAVLEDFSKHGFKTGE
jgi:HEPN domain-containing protein